MEPNLDFLSKVERREVHTFYDRSGGFVQFIGDELTVKEHANAGLVLIEMPRTIKEWGKITITDAGRQALQVWYQIPAMICSLLLQSHDTALVPSRFH